MKILLIGHAYAASYNRKDKLSRIAKDQRIEKLAVITPRNWYDRMLKVSRVYEKIPTDELYEIFPLASLFNGSQSKHVYLPTSLSQIVRQFQPDLIHVEQEFHDWILWEVVLLNKISWHKPLSVFVWENLSLGFNPLTTAFMRFVAKNIDYLIAGNKEAISVAQKCGFHNTSSVIPQFGVDVTHFHPMDVTTLKHELGINETFVIGFVGRYVREKGIQTLIKAIEHLSHTPQTSNFTALFLSSMAPPEWLKDRTQKMGEKVRFINQIPHEKFPRYMNLFDVLVLPSETQENWKEQFGRVMIEAMACSVPVVGSTSGAIPEVIGDYGLIFEERNSQDLAEKLASLLINPALVENLRRRARPYVLGKYTHEKVVERTINVWECLVSKNSSVLMEKQIS